MKFTDGAWLHQPGVRAHYSTEAHDLTQEGNELVVHAATRPIKHRGDTLQGPLLTYRIGSPLEGVIRIRIEHFSGNAVVPVRIPLQPLPAPNCDIRLGEDGASFRSGDLEARITRGGQWELAFSAGGRLLTRSGPRHGGYVEWPGQGNFVHEGLSLGVGEQVYGLGERFTAFTKNGQVVESTNKDGGTGSEQAYKSVPFYLTSRGYGVLVNEASPVSFEVASEKVSRVQFSVAAESLEYFVIAGPAPKDVLRRLTALTGRPALPPAWSFGLWLTTSFTTSYDEATVTSFIDGMKQRQLPLHVFHFDCFWMREFNWCDFQWDPRTFPDPIGLVKRLRARRLRVCLWINPYIAQRSALFDEGRRGGFLVKRADGGIWQTDLWQPGMAIVDFTNPEARAWYAGHLRRLLDQGVDCFKTDFGERIPTDVVWHDGSDPAGMHNLYSVLYNETVFNLLEDVRGRGHAIVFARSSFASGQRFPAHWGGDCWSNFESMAESLRGGLSLGLCGFGYWSHDIGGFEGQPAPEIYKRWVAFGLLSSHSRLHGSTSYRVPWDFDEEACTVLRHFTRLKCRLMPALWAAAVQAHREGVPMMRAMVLEFPDDPACATLDRQYMLGDSLLVAPVLAADGGVDYYLPPGRWTHVLSGEVQEGGRWHRAVHDFLSLPLFVRPGAILPLGAVDERPDYDFAEGVTFRIPTLDDGAASVCEIPEETGGRGVVCRVTRTGRVIEVRLSGRLPGAWKVQFAGVPTVDLEAGRVEADPLGAIALPPSGATVLRARLPAG